MGLSIWRVHSVAQPQAATFLDLQMSCPLADLSLLYLLSMVPIFGAFLHRLEKHLSMGLSISVVANLIGARWSLPYVIQSCLELRKEKWPAAEDSSS